jgi:prevent-host-death family protein
MERREEMEPQKAGIEEARRKLGDLVSAAANVGTVTILTKGGIPAAAIIPLSMLPS